MTSRELVSWGLNFERFDAFLNANVCRIFRNNPSTWRVRDGHLHLTTSPGSVWGDFGRKVPASNLLYWASDSAKVPSPLSSQALQQPFHHANDAGNPIYTDMTGPIGSWFAFTTVYVSFITIVDFVDLVSAIPRTFLLCSANLTSYHLLPSDTTALLTSKITESRRACFSWAKLLLPPAPPRPQHFYTLCG